MIFTCDIYNGSIPLIKTVYKDDPRSRNTMVVGTAFPFTINRPNDNHYGTYTFVVSSENCDAARAVSRILQAGQY